MNKNIISSNFIKAIRKGYENLKAHRQRWAKHRLGEDRTTFKMAMRRPGEGSIGETKV